MEEQPKSISAAAETGPIEVRIGLGHIGDQTFDIRVSPEMEESLQETLDDAGVSTSKVLEFSAGSELAILAVSFVHTGGLVGLAYALQVWLRRHRDKSVKLTIGDSHVEVNGLSEKASRRILVDFFRKLRRAQYERDWQWHAQVDDPASVDVQARNLLSALRLGAASMDDPERSVAMWVMTPEDRNPIIRLNQAGYDEASVWLDELQQGPSRAGVYAAARRRLHL